MSQLVGLIVVGSDGKVQAADEGARVLTQATQGEALTQVLLPPEVAAQLVVAPKESQVSARNGRVLQANSLHAGGLSVVTLRVSEHVSQWGYQLMLSASTRGVFDWDAQQRKLVWSAGLSHVLEPPMDDAWWVARAHVDDAARVADELRTMVQEQSPVWATQLRVHSGERSTLWVRLDAQLEYASDGTLKSVVGIVDDISRERELGERLAIAERLAAVGTLAGGVSHEINNPLAWISANINFALEELTRLRSEPNAQIQLDETLAALKDVRSGAERVGLIVRDLKTFARVDHEAAEPVDVLRSIESAITMASAELRQRARLVRALLPVPKVECNEGRLSQVLLNLLLNASQSFEANPTTPNEVCVATAVDREGRVLIEVRDTGKGIAPEVLPRIFDPFFTTKPVGQGTGLGLSICHALVTQMGGVLEVESTVGRGTTVRLRLRPARAIQSVPARPRVAVVDDEQAIVSIMQRVLGSTYEVHTFMRGEEARAGLHALKPDIVFCDVVLPDLSGVELYRHFQQHQPALAQRFVFMTGGLIDDALRAAMHEGVMVLEKPFTVERLRALVKARLAASVSSTSST